MSLCSKLSDHITPVTVKKEGLSAVLLRKEDDHNSYWVRPEGTVIAVRPEYYDSGKCLPRGVHLKH